MHSVLIVATALHVLAGVFWAGSTFVAAYGAVPRVERIVYWQMAAALLVIVAGGTLFGIMRPGGVPGLVLQVGTLCALLAAGVQGAALPAIRQLGRASETEANEGRVWVLASQRISAVFLAVTVVCMAIWRYA